MHIKKLSFIMKNKVLEIQITDDSPIRLNSLNRHISDLTEIENSSENGKKIQPISKNPKKFLPEIKIPEEPASMAIKQSPTFDISQNFQETFNTTKEKTYTITNPGAKDPIDNFDSSCKTLEEQITLEKEFYGAKFKELCNAKDLLKKTISTLEDDSNLEEVIKNNTKKIFFLRKNNDQSKTELFHLKKRVYKAELKIQSVDNEIEGYKNEISELKSKQKQLSINQEEVLKELLGQNEELTLNNKALNEQNLELLSEASELVNDFINKKEFTY